MTQPDLDAALDMLNRAAKAMDLLQSRYQHVESYAKDLAERAERDLALASSQAKDWEIRAAEDEARIEEAKARLAEAERRPTWPNAGPNRSSPGPLCEHAADAERRASQAEHRADHAERSANEAREWLECFYDKIVASFDTRPISRQRPPEIGARGGVRPVPGLDVSSAARIRNTLRMVALPGYHLGHFVPG